MNKNKWINIVTWGLALLPLAVTALLYTRLPATIPGQWHPDGTVRYDPKWNIWMIAGMGPFLAVLFVLLPKLTPAAPTTANSANTTTPLSW